MENYPTEREIALTEVEWLLEKELGKMKRNWVSYLMDCVESGQPRVTFSEFEQMVIDHEQYMAEWHTAQQERLSNMY